MASNVILSGSHDLREFPYVFGFSISIIFDGLISCVLPGGGALHSVPSAGCVLQVPSVSLQVLIPSVDGAKHSSPTETFQTSGDLPHM